MCIVTKPFLLFLVSASTVSALSHYEAVTAWKEQVVEKLPERMKICEDRNSVMSSVDMNTVSSAYRQVYSCVKDEEYIVQYDRAGQEEARWTWNTHSGDTVSYQDKHSDILLIQYHTITYAYTHYNSTYTLCTISALASVGYPRLRCSESSGQAIQITSQAGTTEPGWYQYARIVLQDTRISTWLWNMREPAELVYLTLPYIRQHILSDGKYGE